MKIFFASNLVSPEISFHFNADILGHLLQESFISAFFQMPGILSCMEHLKKKEEMLLEVVFNFLFFLSNRL